MPMQPRPRAETVGPLRPRVRVCMPLIVSKSDVERQMLRSWWTVSPSRPWHPVGVPELELTRDPADRRRYVLEGVGSLRVEGFARRRATIEADGRTWQAAPIGFWKRSMVATDAAGETVAEFEPRRIRSGGALRVGARELEIAPASKWKQRYALKH